MIRQMAMEFRLWKVCRALQIKPLPWQAQYATAKEPPRLSGGRRSGKTTAVILRALVQRPRCGQDLAQILSQDPDANTAERMRFIYGEYRRRYRECVIARSIPGKQPPIWQEAVRRTWEPPKAQPPSLDQSVTFGEVIKPDMAASTDEYSLLYANDQISAVVKKTMGIPVNYALPEAHEEWQCISRSLQAAASAADEVAKVYISLIRAIRDADLIGRYGTPKEIRYITHGRKARTRKKYRNRVLRRARRAERRNARENRTPRA